MIRSICGLIELQDGFLSISHQVYFDSTQGLCRSPEKRRIGYMPQSIALFPHLNVYHNIAFGLRYQPLSAHQKKVRIDESLDRFRLGDLRYSSPHQLSGGEAEVLAVNREGSL